MVQVTRALPRDERGGIDTALWCETMCREHVWLQIGRLMDVCRYLESLPGAQRLLERGLPLAELVASLRIDNEALLAALLYRPHRDGLLSIGDIARRHSDEVASLVEGVARMATANVLDLSNTPLLTSERQDQVENVRRMLVALVDDARVAVIKVAERVVALREAKSADEERRRRIALEARQIFAPLAGRMGIWHLKWELEDLAMRYLEPDVYASIARQLDGRRAEREARIAALADELKDLLANHGVRATVVGRAKHIYSIWKKMQSKHLTLDQVYDMRALRVLVDDLEACYRALGVVHTEFQHVPSAFDDYIAAPKENGYRSIHTAVIGKDGKILEVQIRTHEMHAEAELGCAPTGPTRAISRRITVSAQKMDWLRHVVEWHDEMGGRSSISEELTRSFSQERIYVYTPKGHVIDLVADATPLDFAFRVHTNVGQHCVGARVDGREVPLNQRLHNGERVEILTSPTQEPRRVWLEPEAAYVHTNRARSKIQAWLRSRGDQMSRAEGLAAVSRACERLAVPLPSTASLRALVEDMGEQDFERFLVSLGNGDCPVRPLISAWIEELGITRGALPEGVPDAGVDPAIVNRGAVHRLVLHGRNRGGLLLDVTRVVDDHGISLLGSMARVVPPDGATIALEFAADDLLEVYHLIENLRPVVGVLDVRREVIGD
ncbi:MAG: HD domain-containing protein [Pseudomonadales bacterium]